MPNNAQMQPQVLSASVGDYLKAIWLLGHPEAATTKAIAAQLGVSPASVSGMLGKLHDLGLVRYARYHGACLTDAGRAEALRLVRRHRLLETFLHTHLGYPWDAVHAEAERLEHVISERFTERLAAFLGELSFDPHGDPIPQADGALPETRDLPLAELLGGQGFRVHRLKTQESGVLAHFASLGLVPGQCLIVRHHDPVAGLLHLELGGQARVLTTALAELVRGERVSEEET